MEELVRLPESRYGHACAALPSTGVRCKTVFGLGQAKTPWAWAVSPISIFNLQALLVAGGKDDGSQTWRSLSSVLSLSPEGTAWTPLDSLPRSLASLRGSIVGDLDDWVFRVTGGYTALWADWVVRNAFKRFWSPVSQKFCILFLIHKSVKFWKSLERILWYLTKTSFQTLTLILSHNVQGDSWKKSLFIDLKMKHSIH